MAEKPHSCSFQLLICRQSRPALMQSWFRCIESTKLSFVAVLDDLLEGQWISMIVCELHAGDSAVTEPKIWFSTNEILREWNFDNHSDKNVDPTFSLPSLSYSFIWTQQGLIVFFLLLWINSSKYPKNEQNMSGYLALTTLSNRNVSCSLYHIKLYQSSVCFSSRKSTNSSLCCVCMYVCLRREETTVSLADIL